MFWYYLVQRHRQIYDQTHITSFPSPNAFNFSLQRYTQIFQVIFHKLVFDDFSVPKKLAWTKTENREEQLTNIIPDKTTIIKVLTASPHPLDAKLKYFWLFFISVDCSWCFQCPQESRLDKNWSTKKSSCNLYQSPQRQSPSSRFMSHKNYTQQKLITQ